MSKIVVIEGADRCGKATQASMLREYLMSIGCLTKIVEVPIRSAVTYKIIYWMLRNGFAKSYPKLFQWFQFLNRKIFQLFVLPDLERQYDIIVMDRWSLSTIVYGSAEGVSEEFTVALSKKLRSPDHTIILYGQSFPHEAEDVYEQDQDLQDRVRMGYAQWAASNPQECTLINCKQDKKTIFKKIKASLELKGIIPRR
jgi:thymidylate kinase